MTYWYPLNFALGSVFTILAGLFVLFGGESRRITRHTWFLLCLSTSFWHAGRFLMSVAPSALSAERAIYVIYFGAIFIPALFVHFVLSLLNEEKQQRTILIFSYLAAAVQIALLVSGYLTHGVHRYSTLGFYEVPTRLYLIHFGVFITLPAYALGRAIKTFLQSDLVTQKNQLKYVIYASLIGFLGGGTSFLPLLNPSIPPLGAPLTYFYTFPIAYAVGRYRLMDIDIVIKESLIHVFTLLALIVPCSLLVVWWQNMLLGFSEILMVPVVPMKLS